MLEIFIGGEEYWNESLGEFSYVEPTKLTLEHSLISVSKWESKYHKPFLTKENKTEEETLDYIRFMMLTDVDESIVDKISRNDISAITKYIEDSQTATWFREAPGSAPGGRHSSEQITSELIYYWMVANQIPFECEKWHLNRLLTLIRICNVKNNSGKKMGKRDILSSNAALNAARRKQMGSMG